MFFQLLFQKYLVAKKDAVNIHLLCGAIPKIGSLQLCSSYKTVDVKVKYPHEGTNSLHGVI
jgi:hypothetical protein